MATILEVMEELTADPRQREWHHPAIRRYLTTGEAKELAKVPTLNDKGLPGLL